MSPEGDSNSVFARIAWPAAILGPSLVAAALVPLRSALDPTNVALILVVVVVAVAAIGRRLPGLVAAVVAGIAFDYLWAAPYYRFTIKDPNLIQTAILLVIVGAAVSELAWLGQHARQQSARSRGYLAGAVDVVATFDPNGDPAAQVHLVEQRVTEILDADSCHYTPGPLHSGAATARLDADGAIRIGDHTANADRNGLPTDRTIMIPVTVGGQTLGYLSVIAASRLSRPTREQRQVAVLMAAQLGEVLARTEHPKSRSGPGDTAGVTAWT
jgi:K+-sensing histidine kinase KdpD